MYEMPKEDNDVFEALSAGEKLMYCVPFNIQEGKFVSGFLAVTTKKIYKILNGRLLKSFVIKDGSDFKTESMYGSAGFYAKFDGYTTLIAQFVTGRHLARYQVIAKACEILAETDNDTPVTNATPERFCPKCNRPFVNNTSICPYCLDKKVIYKKLWAMTKGLRFIMFAPFIILMIATLIRLIDPMLVRYCVDNFMGNFATPEVRANAGGAPKFIFIAIVLIFINIAARGLGVLQGRLSAISAGRFSVMLRTLVYEKIESLSLSSIQRRSTGDLMGRVTNDTNVMQSFIINQFPNLFIQVFMIFVSTALLMFINVVMALFIIIPVPFALFIISRFWTYIRRKNLKIWVLNTRTGHLLQDILNGIRVVKSFGTEEAEIERFKETSTRAALETEKNSKQMSTLFPALSFFIRLGSYIILLYGSYMVYKKAIGGVGMSLGELVQFTNYTGYIFAPLMWMTDIPNILANFMTSASKVFEILEETPEVTDIDMPVDAKLEGHIKINNITFGYESYNPVLENVSLEILPGEMVGIVGHSGSGKTTLINLLMRLYEVNEGSITIDDIDIKHISQGSLRSQIGAVLQETFLFSGTIAENIRYSNPHATDEEIISAAKTANAHDFIINLPDGYNTMVGEKGYSLSGGERQRIAIARAIIHNPTILILDEATASLDTETEKLIQEALDKLSKGRTTISIAHRLTTLQDADKLLVLDKGKVAEFGTHSQLLQKKGIYYKLVMAQIKMASSVMQ